ncbi:hypothetical protein Pelo_10376 [Pelomyxa schiedti]|nr:hypothetical protein Pelo_10376 [Pelomyxa schiedti]
MTEWQAPLFSCKKCSCRSFCYAFCCSSCASATAVNNFDDTNWCIACMYSSAPLVRNHIRMGYGIEGTYLQDALIGCLLPWCSTCQVLEEVKKRGAPPTAKHMKS